MNIKTCPDTQRKIMIAKKGITSKVDEVRLSLVAQVSAHHYHQTAGNLCYESNYSDKHYASLGYKAGRCPSKFNALLSTEKVTVCDGHSDMNIKTCPDTQRKIMIAKKGITSKVDEVRLSLAAQVSAHHYHQTAGNLC